ncbi:hypothetical protein D3C84_740950 [compost metagenome]
MLGQATCEVAAQQQRVAAGVGVQLTAVVCAAGVAATVLHPQVGGVTIVCQCIGEFGFPGALADAGVEQGVHGVQVGCISAAFGTDDEQRCWTRTRARTWVNRINRINRIDRVNWINRGQLVTQVPVVAIGALSPGEVVIVGTGDNPS